MSKKHTQALTFSEKMTKYAKNKLTETKRIAIAKKRYLLSKEVDLIKAKDEGYTYAMIAEVATIEFLKLGIQKTFTVKNKEGKEVEFETKIRAVDIKNICEPENNK